MKKVKDIKMSSSAHEVQGKLIEILEKRNNLKDFYSDEDNNFLKLSVEEQHVINAWITVIKFLEGNNENTI